MPQCRRYRRQPTRRRPAYRRRPNFLGGEMKKKKKRKEERRRPQRKKRRARASRRPSIEEKRRPRWKGDADEKRRRWERSGWWRPSSSPLNPRARPRINRRTVPFTKKSRRYSARCCVLVCFLTSVWGVSEGVSVCQCVCVCVCVCVCGDRWRLFRPQRLSVVDKRRPPANLK